jgi:hypothetical protein
MTLYQDITDAAARMHLAPFGAFHPNANDAAPKGCKTLILFGPKDPEFWPYFQSTPEAQDGRPDPLDRWSTRVMGDLAVQFDAQPILPFAGPPWHPFIAWAKRSGRIWQSPVTILVHDTAGMMVSFRGALALRDHIALPHETQTRPCERCTTPCATACPVGALGPDGYDTDACHAFLDTKAGQDCLTQGCKARRACPISQSYGRLPAQSAFHMRHFHP